MRKSVVFYTLLSLILVSLACKAAEEYVTQPKMYTDVSVSMFQTVAGQYDNFLKSLSKKLNAKNISYDEIIKNINYTTLSKGVFEVKYIKLSNICTPVPNDYTKSPNGACAKVIIDTNGFKNPPNKLFSDTSTLIHKDQYVMYMYSNGLKAKYNSPEDLILYLKTKVN